MTLRPVFEPAISLGWRDIALDGLSCYLRCVESVLRAHGYDTRRTVDALALPLSLVQEDGSGFPFGDYPGCEIEWRTVPPGESLWDELLSNLAVDRFAVLSPDAFWWPGDELRGRLNAHHHMVLPVSFDRGELELLDTDAPADGGFRSRLPYSDDLRLSVNTIGLVRVRPSRDVPALSDDPTGLLAESATAVRADLAEFRLLAETWKAQPPSPMLARALHVLMLGEVQPPLFLFASALEAVRDPQVAAVREAAYASAAQAKKLGILLTGLHRFDSAMLYQIGWGELDELNRSLEVLAGALDAACVSASDSTSVPRSLSARLSGIERWCFAQSGQAATQWLVEPR